MFNCLACNDFIQMKSSFVTQYGGAINEVLWIFYPFDKLSLCHLNVLLVVAVSAAIERLLVERELLQNEEQQSVRVFLVR